MSLLRPLKLLYTGVWASGYMKRKDTFSRVNIKNISLVVHTDDTFRLSAGTVYSDDNDLESFSLTGRANITYESTGEVDEILLSGISYKGSTLEEETIFSISRKKCTRLPIPNGEAFFCFSSRLPPVNVHFEPRDEPEQPPIFDLIGDPLEDDAEMSFDDIFNAPFDASDFDVDRP